MRPTGRLVETEDGPAHLGDVAGVHVGGVRKDR